MFSRGTNPQYRLSRLWSRLSPRTKYWPRGTMSSPFWTRVRNCAGPVDADIFIDRIAARKIVAKFIREMLFEYDVGLNEGVPIDIDAGVPQMYVVAGKSDDALDEVLRRVHGIAEDNDVSAVNGAVGENGLPGTGGAEASFIHQKVVANQQGVFHGA